MCVEEISGLGDSLRFLAHKCRPAVLATQKARATPSAATPKVMFDVKSSQHQVGVEKVSLPPRHSLAAFGFLEGYLCGALAGYRELGWLPLHHFKVYHALRSRSKAAFDNITAGFAWAWGCKPRSTYSSAHQR